MAGQLGQPHFYPITAVAARSAESVTGSTGILISSAGLVSNLGVVEVIAGPGGPGLTGLVTVAGTGDTLISAVTATNTLVISSTAQTITVNSISGSTGILISPATTGNVTVSNVGVVEILSGVGITSSASTGLVTIGNLGVQSVSGTSGVFASASTGNVVLSVSTGTFALSSAATSYTAGTGIAITSNTWFNLGAVVITGTSGVNASASTGLITLSISTATFALSSAATSYTAGTGIGISSNTWFNLGVVEVLSGVGITSSASTGLVTIGNLGVQSVSGTSGVFASASTGNVVLSVSTGTFALSSASTSYSAGTGIAITSNTWFNLGAVVITGTSGVNASASTGLITLSISTGTFATSSLPLNAGTGILITSPNTINNVGAVEILSGVGITSSAATGLVTVGNMGVQQLQAVSGSIFAVTGIVAVTGISGAVVNAISPNTIQIGLQNITASASVTGGTSILVSSSVISGAYTAGTGLGLSISSMFSNVGVVEILSGVGITSSASTGLVTVGNMGVQQIQGTSGSILGVTGIVSMTGISGAVVNSISPNIIQIGLSNVTATASVTGGTSILVTSSVISGAYTAGTGLGLSISSMFSNVGVVEILSGVGITSSASTGLVAVGNMGVQQIQGTSGSILGVTGIVAMTGISGAVVNSVSPNIIQIGLSNVTATASVTGGTSILVSSSVISGAYTAGTGLGLSISSMFSNVGVVEILSGVGITSSASTGLVTIGSLDVQAISAGSALLVNASTGSVVISNAGVWEVLALSGAQGAFTGVIAITGVSGIYVQGISSGTQQAIQLSFSSNVYATSSLPLNAGTGILISSPNTINNVGLVEILATSGSVGGITGLVAVTGITGIQVLGVSDMPNRITFANLGVVQISTLVGITSSASTGLVSIGSMDVQAISGGSGISVSPSTGNVLVNNTGVWALTGGTGHTVSASTGNVTISVSGLWWVATAGTVTIAVSAGAGQLSTTIQQTGSIFSYTIPADGVGHFCRIYSNEVVISAASAVNTTAGAWLVDCAAYWTDSTASATGAVKPISVAPSATSGVAGSIWNATAGTIQSAPPGTISAVHSPTMIVNSFYAASGSLVSYVFEVRSQTSISGLYATFVIPFVLEVY